MNVHVSKKWISFVRRFVPSCKDMLDERGQAMVRVVVSAATMLYLGGMSYSHIVAEGVPFWFAFSIGYTVLSIIAARHILRSHSSPPTRRYLGNVCDITAITYLMISAGEIGVPLFVLYMLVTLGNGFRYGVAALLISTALSIVGFGLTVFLTQAWQVQSAFSAGVLLALVVLPFGAVPLIRQLSVARARMKEEHISLEVSRVSNRRYFSEWALPVSRTALSGGNILDRERGQALLRVGVTAVATIYVLLASQPLTLASEIPPWLILGAGYLIFAAVLAWRVQRAQSSPPARRYLGVIGDVAAISYGMLEAGEAGIPLFALYLWITFGNGFRYGDRALIISAVTSVVGFSVVVSLSESWQAHPNLLAGVLFSLMMLPLYAGHLLRLLNAALNRANEANAAKGQFLARMSHELRTPLNGILGSAELLRGSRRLSPEERSLLDVIEESVNVSLRQINNVLDFSKLEAGKLTLEQTDVVLPALINTTASMVRPAATQKGLRFLVRIAPNVPWRVTCDGHHFRTILLNLLSNAVKFTERGSVWLDVMTVAHGPGDVRVRFEVRDTGIGIAPEAIGRIFDSFAQEDTGTMRRYGGSGLGTTIAKQLVELMEGRIGVESTKGGGSLFWYEIPLSESAEPATNPLASDARMLLLTRDPVLARTFQDLLASRLVCAESDVEVITVLTRAMSLGNPIDLVLLDDVVARDARGIHQCADLCNKAAMANVPVVLVVDDSPSAHNLREWGYSAVLSRTPTLETISSITRVLPSRGRGSDSKIATVPPWRWTVREEIRPRVLIADDNRTNLMITRRMLEQGGYEVEAVASGDAALEKLRAGGFRLAVLDMHMPGLDGPDAVRQYRLMRPRSNLPIIVLTANVAASAQHVCAEAGADAYLAKPVTARQLLTEVKRLLDDTEIEVLPWDRGRRGASAPAETATLPLAEVLDLSVLAELDRIYWDPKELALLVQEYERESRELLDRVATACWSRNHSLFCDAVHALKSNASNVGARRLMEACRIAGAIGIVEFTANREHILAELREAFSGAVAALQEIASTAARGPGKSVT